MSSPVLVALFEVAAGCILLIWAADRLVAGAAALSQRLNVSPLVVGIGIIGFGTSAPELLVSVMSAWRGNPGLAVGNALGSNMANIGLILGLTALIYPLSVAQRTVRRDLPLLFAVMALTSVLMLDYFIGRFEAAVLLLTLMGVLTWLMRAELKHSNDASASPTPAVAALSQRIALMWIATGLLLLPMSAHILVNGAITMATLLGISDVVIGLTIVAIGTSLPELAAAAASAWRREDNLTIGNIIGSNLFNLLGVLGVAALIAPMAIESTLLSRDMAAMFAITLLLLLVAGRRGRSGEITRVGGGLLLLSYLLYQTVVIGQAMA